MSHDNTIGLFNALPTDLQDKICEKIVYEQPVILMNEIKTTRFSESFYEIQKVFIDNPKKLNGLTDTLVLMRKHGAEKQADVFEKIIEEIMQKEKLQGI